LAGRGAMGQGLWQRSRPAAVTDYAFEAMELPSLRARYRIGNAASRRILAGTGLCELGEIKSHSKATGGETVVMRLELSRAAWEQARSGGVMLRSRRRLENLGDVAADFGFAAEAAVVLRGRKPEIAARRLHRQRQVLETVLDVDTRVEQRRNCRGSRCPWRLRTLELVESQFSGSPRTRVVVGFDLGDRSANQVGTPCCGAMALIIAVTSLSPLDAVVESMLK
jgi:hypothetical protein